MAFYEKQSTAITAVVLAVVLLGVTEAQKGIPSCASKLVPCYSFLNSTATPNQSCCGSIRDAVANDLPCLCTIYSDPTLLASFNVSLDQAVGLSRRCNIPSDLSACNSTGSPGNSPSPPGGRGDTGGASRIAWAGLTGLLLFWASMMLY